MSVFPFQTKKVWVSLIAILFLSPFNNLKAQQNKTSCDYSLPGEVLNWNFGEKAQLQFSEEMPYPLSTAMPDNIDLQKGVSSISDTDGQLLFFSNGIAVFGIDYQELTNSNELIGYKYADQSALFIPSPGNPNRYYLITSELYVPENPNSNGGIRYSVIEKEGNSWKVLSDKMNILLLEQNATKLAAVKHEDGENFWLITHGFGENKGDRYYSFLVTNDNISHEYIESKIGVMQSGNIANSAGYLKISPNGQKLATVLPIDGVVEVADFNAATGKVSQAISSSHGRYNYPLGVEFSPNNKLLYITTSPLAENPNKLFQFNLETLDINNPTEIISFTYSNQGWQFGGLQLAVDGRIYIGTSKRSLGFHENLAVIYNPNRSDIACNFNMLDGTSNDGLALQNGSGSMGGLPNFISSYLDIPHFWWQNHCEKSPTIFRLQNEANAGDVEWSLDDGTVLDNHNQRRGEYTFEEAGIYTINVKETYNGIPYTFKRDIEIYPLPPVEIGENEDIIYILPNSSITLDAGEYDEYVWYLDGNPIPDATQQTLDVEEEGLYKVIVTDYNCCANFDEVEIRFANVYMPNAFRPKSNIPDNQTFKPLGAVSALNKFELLVYNRWGQLVFESNSPTDGWDGTINGKDAPAEAYVWLMRYESFESTFQAAQEVVQRGVINLIR